MASDNHVSGNGNLPGSACGLSQPFLQGLDPQVQTLMMADAPGQEAEQPGPSPCQLGAQSLLCAQPLFFDGALPAIIIFFALLQLFTQRRTFLSRSSLSRHRLPEYTSKTAFSVNEKHRHHTIIFTIHGVKHG